MDIDFSEYYNPKPQQAIAHKCRAKYLLFGGAMGGGKSWFLCAEAIKNAMMFNGNRIVLVRKELSVLRKTTLVTFESICPPELIKSFNQSTMEITFINGSVLIFIDANIAKDPLLQKIKGLEIGWFGIDESNEIAKDVYNILKTRLRWVLPDGTTPRYEGRLTSNPEAGWLYPTFVASTNLDEVYIQSLTTDNYDENSEYVRTLKETYKDTPMQLRRYLYADWSVADKINQLITGETITKAADRVTGLYDIALGVDVARYGDDKTALVLLKEGNIELIEIYAYNSITEVATRVMQLMSDYNIEPSYVGIDGVGVGAGVVDILKSNGYEIRELQGGAKPVETYYEQTFKASNLRSQMYWELREAIVRGEVGNITDESLRSELQAIQYEIANEKTVSVVSKKVVKKLLGRSPDLADALVYANWVRMERISFPLCIPPCFGSNDNFGW